MKTVLFAPGFRSEEILAEYKGKPALDAIAKAGYRVEFVPLHWSNRTIKHWIKQFDDEYQKHDPKNTILAGFSFGAIAALVLAAERLPAELWLFSLSPFFAEDMERQKPAYLAKYIGARRSEAFRQLQFEPLPKTITCPVKIFVGGEEVRRFPGVRRRSQELAARLPQAQCIEAEGADHDIGSPSYIAAITKNI